MTQSQRSDAAIEMFVNRFPATQTRAVGPGFLDRAQAHLPAVLVEVYREYGLGWFGDQDLELVDPGVWEPVVSTWFGADAASVPVAVTSFGHLFHLDADGAVQCLDPHFLTNTVVAADLEEFFGTYLVSDASHLSDLRGPHQGAVRTLGRLGLGELYGFEPILPLGGRVSPESLVKVDGVEQLLRTYELVRERGRV